MYKNRSVEYVMAHRHEYISLDDFLLLFLFDLKKSILWAMLKDQ